MEYLIRAAKLQDLDEICRIEEICFPPEEAADKHSLKARLEVFHRSFYVAEDSERHLIGFINGNITDSRAIQDDMFENVNLHNPNGSYQSIFGLDVAPSSRGMGVAAGLMRHLMAAAKSQGRKGLILTCKEQLISYYEQFGYHSLGISASVHGGAVWYDMILEFREEMPYEKLSGSQMAET